MRTLNVVLVVCLFALLSYAANDFSGSSTCVALYRFESGALQTDSKSTNTLTGAATPDESTAGGGFQEGSCAADFELANTDTQTVTDANLSAGFPAKNGTTTPKFTICFWFKPETTSSNGILYKGTSTGGTASWYITTSSGSAFRLGVGTTNGDAWDAYTHASAITVSQWYHVAVSYDDSDKSYRIRVWDATAAGILGVDKTGTATNNMNVENGAFNIGDSPSGYNNLDGILDEVVIFNSVLTTTQTDAIRAGTFVEAAATRNLSKSLLLGVGP